MESWICERCGYTHTAESPQRIPSRCPSCRSTRLRRTVKPPADEGWRDTSTAEIYRILDRITGMSIQEQEESRRTLKEHGVHVLCVDERSGNLGSLLTRNEVEGYLSLIRNQNFGLAVIGRSVVAVSPSSPIRLHVGVNQLKLRELEEAEKKEGGV